MFNALLQEPSPYELGILLGLDLNIQAAPKVSQNAGQQFSS